MKCCPICESIHYIKHGLYKEIQRYKCKDCNKTFSKTTNSLWSYSKKSPELWIEFIELMVEKKSYIVPYGDRYIDVAAKKHNKKRFLEVKDDDRLKYFILNLKNWLQVLRGIATKYLQRYLSFFVLFNLDQIFDCMQIMHCDLLNENRFIKTNKIRSIENYMY